MRVLGIDFGTSNTVAMLRTPDGRVRPLLFDGSPLLPSAVYLGTDGRTVVGRDAERNARVDPSRFEPNPKRRIDDVSVFLGDREIPVARVMGSVLELVASEARRQLGALPDEVRLTHPARWAERRRSILVEAATIAGLPRPKLIAEPVAAASYFTAVLGTAVPVGRSLAIYDLGGGTFDATVVRRTAGGFEVLAEGGLPDVGGLDFDHAVIQHLGKTYSATHASEWERLQTPVDGGDRRHRRMLWEDVRGAKEMLSRTSSADIHLPALEVDAHVVREELEQLIRPHLERTVQCLVTTVNDAHLQPRDLVGIFLVGGSSRIPLAAHLIHSQLGVAPTTLEQPETVVAEGALRVGTMPDAEANRPGSAPPAQRPTGPPPRPAQQSGPQPQQQRPVGPPPRAGAAPMLQGQAGPPQRPGPYAPGRPVSAPPPVSPGQHPRQGPLPPRPAQPAYRPAGPPPNQPPNNQQPRIQPLSAPPQRPIQQPPVQPAPRPVQRQQPAPPAGTPARKWHQEPAVVVTILIAAAVVIGFVILLIITIANGNSGRT